MTRTARRRATHARLGLVRSLAARPSSVVIVGIAMIVVQLAFRAWALYGGYFLIDDFGFLANTVDRDLSWSFLLTPYGDHLQPLGFLIVWLVGQSEPYDWTLATSITLTVQAMASSACFAFLLRLCGRQWTVLVPLGFYLFAVTSLPGFMWWAAAIVQVPLQLAAFLAMWAHVQYVRTRKPVHIAVTGLAIAGGMLCDVKVAFVGMALAFLSLYLSDARGVRGRLVDAVARQWTAWTVYGLMFSAYLVAYLNLGSVGNRGLEAPLAILDSMVRFTLGPLFLGGPWRWGEMRDIPLVSPTTPEWLVTLTWVVLALLVSQAVRRRPATAWVGVLLLSAVSVNVLMVSVARGAVFGGAAGLEIRYLGDLTPVLVLVVAVLACSVRPSAEPPPRHPGRIPDRTTVSGIGAGLLCLAVLSGAFISSSAYVRNWHSDYPARVFFENASVQAEQRVLRVLDQQLPQDVIPREGSTTFEVPSQVLTPLGDRLEAAMRMNDPEVLDPNGIAYRAVVDARRQSPPGPVEGCGYVVDDRARTIPLEPVEGAEPLGGFWWGSIGYLASADGVATLSYDGVSTDMEVKAGLHDYFFLGSGPGDDVTLQMRSSGTACVDNVRAGVLEPNDEEATR